MRSGRSARSATPTMILIPPKALLDAQADALQRLNNGESAGEDAIGMRISSF